jgi:hypothetical protein
MWVTLYNDNENIIRAINRLIGLHLHENERYICNQDHLSRNVKRFCSLTGNHRNVPSGTVRQHNCGWHANGEGHRKNNLTQPTTLQITGWNHDHSKSFNNHFPRFMETNCWDVVTELWGETARYGSTDHLTLRHSWFSAASPGRR